MTEYSVLDRLPYPGKKVLCFGHATFCCEEDMDEADWHEVIFLLIPISWNLKKEIPKDLEESIYDWLIVSETWQLPGDHEPGDNNRVIGVTKWKYPEVPK